MAHVYDFYKPNLASEYPVLFPKFHFTWHFFTYTVAIGIIFCQFEDFLTF